MKPLTITQAAKVTGVSRVTLHRYVKAGKLSRSADGTFDPVELQRAGFTLRNTVADEQPPATVKQRHETLFATDEQDSATLPQPPATPDTTYLFQLIDTLRDELASAKERERVAHDESRLEKERLMMLLAQEQQNMQRLLSAGQPSRPGFWQRVGEWFSKATQHESNQ